MILKSFIFDFRTLILASFAFAAVEICAFENTPVVG